MRFSCLKIAATTSLAAGLMAFAVPASAAVVLTATPGTNPYSGPAPTYDFETPAPVIGGQVVSGSTSGIAAQPFGSTGSYLAVGPSHGGPAFLDLSTFGALAQVSFLWGSIDSYNSFDVVDGMNNILASFNGSDAAVNPNGNQSSPLTNRVAFLTFTGADRTAVSGIRFASTSNAFEIDNISIQSAVPEPGTWMTMLLGFGLIGGALRSRTVRSRFRGRAMLAS